jgi:hypothetical protein
MRVQLALCAESTSIDRNTNKLSVFNISDRLVSLTFPLWIPKMFLVLNLKREGTEASEGRGRLRISQSAIVLSERDVLLRFRKENDICKVILAFDAAVPAPEELLFSILFEGVETELYRLAIIQPRNLAQQSDLNFSPASLPGIPIRKL